MSYQLHSACVVTIPPKIIESWRTSHGDSDLPVTLAQVRNAARAIEDLWKIRHIDLLPAELGRRVSNPHFLSSDLGKFVQVAILIGRKVKPNHFFRGTNVQWDRRSLLQVKGIYEAQYNMGEEFFTVETVYRGDVILVTKTISELLELFYCM
jgi:hypothetical protein